MMKKCVTDGCDRKTLARGLCRMHYLRAWKRKGSDWEKSLLERFEEKYIPTTESGCWLWTDSHESSGYGFMSYKGKKIKAHRISYELFIGKIPETMFVCHKCDVKCCVNPNHLFIGTQQDNMDDMKRKGREVHQHGEHVGTAKLTEEMVKEILSSHEPQRKTAEIFGVSKTVVGYIRRREFWKHVPFPSEENQ